MDFAKEYHKILAFRRFKKSVIDYFIQFLLGRIRANHKQPRKTTHSTNRWTEHIFTKWWFYTVLHDGVEAFLPTSTLLVQVKDIDYHLRSYDIVPTEVDMGYDHAYVAQLCETYRNASSNGRVLPVRATLNRGKIQVWSDREAPLETVDISPVQEEKLRSRFLRPINELPSYAAIEALRLTALGAISEHLSIPPVLLGALEIDTECFGTPLNTSLNRFCSPFYDIEQAFGSLGNFMDFRFESGKHYTFNPPYDLDLMTETTQHLIQLLATIPDVTVLVLLPVWDPETQQRMGAKNYSEPFPAFDLIRNSGYARQAVAVKKDEFPYYSYFRNEFVPAANTHIMLMTNREELPTGWSIERIDQLWPTLRRG
jgi:hypothetical protein